MQCSYCGKSIQSDEVAFEGLSFCNNLCKHLWQKGNTAAAEGFELCRVH
jgi:hypothetical protein